jgi:dTMP kinase
MRGRGALIVFEGLDRSGKSTQAQLLLNALKDHYKMQCELWKYPNRTTQTGKLINDYLMNKAELEDHAVHLLFSANRWETVDEMKAKLHAGVNLIIDRYAYSGTAYSAAKKTLNFDWCKQCDNGLPKPDLVCFMDTSASLELGSRDSFGMERYEKIDFLNEVYQNYKKIFKFKCGDTTGENCFVVDAMQPISAIHAKIVDKVLDCTQKAANEPIGSLW